MPVAHSSSLIRWVLLVVDGCMQIIFARSCSELLISGRDNSKCYFIWSIAFANIYEQKLANCHVFGLDGDVYSGRAPALIEVLFIF